MRTEPRPDMSGRGLLDIASDIVDVLAVTFTVINFKINVRDELEVAVLFNVLTELRTISFEEHQRIGFLTVGDGREEYGHAFEVR